MKALLILSLAAIPWFSLGVVLAARAESFGWGCAAAFSIVGCLFIASREWDAIKNDREWKRAYRQPRL